MSGYRTPVHARPGSAAATTAVVAAGVASTATAVSAWAQWTTSAVSGTLFAAAVATFAVVGAVVALARPDNRLGVLLLAGACCSAVGEACRDVGYRRLVGAGPGGGTSALLLAGDPLRGVGWLVLAV